jgi:hypothetical protein
VLPGDGATQMCQVWKVVPNAGPQMQVSNLQYAQRVTAIHTDVPSKRTPLSSREHSRRRTYPGKENQPEHDQVRQHAPPRPSLALDAPGGTPPLSMWGRAALSGGHAGVSGPTDTLSVVPTPWRGVHVMAVRSANVAPPQP